MHGTCMVHVWYRYGTCMVHGENHWAPLCYLASGGSKTSKKDVPGENRWALNRIHQDPPGTDGYAETKWMGLVLLQQPMAQQAMVRAAVIVATCLSKIEAFGIGFIIFFFSRLRGHRAKSPIAIYIYIYIYNLFRGPWALTPGA